MTIKSIDVMNVMVFRRQWRETEDKGNDCFHLDFCDGINVLIGENGVGKTTLLKMIYAATQWSNKKTDERKTKRLLHFFSNNLKDGELLKNVENREDYSFFRVSNGVHCFEESFSHGGVFSDGGMWEELNIQSVFIPSVEMLSHSKGFLAMNQKYNMPFDGTQVDIIVNASLPETRESPAAMGDILEKISAAIGGSVVQEDDTFMS